MPWGLMGEANEKFLSILEGLVKKENNRYLLELFDKKIYNKK
jgi:hypothetical protein